MESYIADHFPATHDEDKRSYLSVKVRHGISHGSILTDQSAAVLELAKQRGLRELLGSCGERGGWAPTIG